MRRGFFFSLFSLKMSVFTFSCRPTTDMSDNVFQVTAILLILHCTGKSMFNGCLLVCVWTDNDGIFELSLDELYCLIKYWAEKAKQQDFILPVYVNAWSCSSPQFHHRMPWKTQWRHRLYCAIVSSNSSEDIHIYKYCQTFTNNSNARQRQRERETVHSDKKTNMSII